MRTHLALSAGTLTIGVVVGWFAHQWYAVSGETYDSETAAEISLVPPDRTRTASQSDQGDPDLTQTDLSEALEDDWNDRESDSVRRFLMLAETDPVAAYEILESVSPRVRRMFREDVYGYWIHLDPQAAFASAFEEPKERRRLLFQHLAQVLAKKDPESALDAGRGLHVGAMRNAFITEVFDALFLEDPVETSRRLAEFPGARLFSPGRFYFESGMAPPDLSVDLMDTLVETLPADRMETILTEIFREYWVNSEVEEAREWAFNLPEGALRERVTEEVLWSDSYSEKRYDRLGEANLTPGERVRLLINRSAAIAATDPMIGLEAAREIADPESRHLAERSVFGTWMANDPVTAIEYLSAEQPADLRYFSAEIAKLLSSNSPQQALTTAQEIAAAAGDSKVLTHVFRDFAEEDITLATAQLENLPVGEDRDASIAGILEGASHLEPSKGLAWAFTINDLEQRSRYVTRQFSAWAEKDPAAAKSWFDREAPMLEPGTNTTMEGVIEQAQENQPRRSRSVDSSFGTMIVYY